MSLLSLQRHPIHTIALGHLDTNMALLSLMIVPICMTITKEFKFQCGSIITFSKLMAACILSTLDSTMFLLRCNPMGQVVTVEIDSKFHYVSIKIYSGYYSLLTSPDSKFQCGSIITPCRF